MKSADRAVPVVDRLPHLPGGRVPHDQPKAIGLESWPRHRKVREPAAIRRIGGLRIPGRVVGSQVDRRGAAVGRHAKDVEVRRSGLGAAADPCRKHHLTAVRAESVVLAATEWPGWHIPIDGPGQHDGRALACAIRIQRDREKPRHSSILPLVPVPHEQLLVALAMSLRRHLLIEAAARAFEVGAVRVHFNRENQAIAAR
jgi:hypothetical protein